jgi:hypothetical protein
VGWEPKLVLKKRFVHPDGREILGFEDEQNWIVELRPPNVLAERKRWYPADERRAAGVVLTLVGDDPSWSEDRWES